MTDEATAANTETKAKRPLWERLVAWVKRHPVGVTILIIAAVAPIAVDVTAVWDWVVRPRSNLMVSRFDEDARIKSPVDPVDTSIGRVYRHAVDLGVTLSTDITSEDDVLIRGLQLEVESFESGTREDLKYERIGSKGVVPVPVFAIELDGNEVRPAKYESPEGVAKSRSEDLLDLPTPLTIRLSRRAGAAHDLRLQLMPVKRGLYTVRLLVDYYVRGQDQVHRSEPLRIYYDR